MLYLFIPFIIFHLSPLAGACKLITQPEPSTILHELHHTYYAIPISAQTHSGQGQLIIRLIFELLLLLPLPKAF